MDSLILDIFRNVYSWAFIGSLAGVFLTLRLANLNRDKAAVVDFPENPEKYIVRSRVFTGFAVIFLLGVLAGLVVVVYDVLPLINSNLSLNPSEAAAVESVTPEPTATQIVIVQPTVENLTPTSTPEPTRTAGPANPAIPEQIGPAEIGNTNFQGVNVREEPTVSSDIVTKLANRTVVEVLDEPAVDADGYHWRMVKLENGKVGWIAQQFLKFMVETED